MTSQNGESGHEESYRTLESKYPTLCRVSIAEWFQMYVDI